MSSGFVSGGTVDQPIERDEEWRKAQQELEDIRKRKEELSRQAEGKSLYEVLQQNKAAKQDAFEESTRLKNQFRSLDEDEVDFLDAVLESTRSKEKAVEKETAAQLKLFRQQQDEAQKALNPEAGVEDTALTSQGAEASLTEDTNWSAKGKKRKRLKEKEILKGVKVRKSSQDPSMGELSFQPMENKVDEHVVKAPMPPFTNPLTTNPPKAVGESNVATPAAGLPKIPATSNGSSGLGLGAYGSDSD